MSEDIGNYKGTIVDSTSFANKNIGKARLNDQDDYTFELQKTILKKGVKNFKGNTVDKVFLILTEIKSKNELVIGFRIDKLNWSTDDKPQFVSPVINFFTKIGMPIPKGVYPDWTQYFVPSMKFKARVTPLLKEGELSDQYTLELATVKKYNPADHPVAPQTAPVAISDADALQSIGLLCKGSTTNVEALQSIANPDLIAKFVQLDKAGKIQYPIKGV